MDIYVKYRFSLILGITPFSCSDRPGFAIPGERVQFTDTVPLSWVKDPIDDLPFGRSFT